MNDPADWLRPAIARWLSGDGELTAMGLSGADRLAARRWLRNQHIRAAWRMIPGNRFSARFSALLAAVERLNRVRCGYRHQRQNGAIFDELEAAAEWADIPNERQLRTVISEKSEVFELQESTGMISLKCLIEDCCNDSVPARSCQDPR